MERTQHSTLLVDANGAGKDGFTNGDPGVTPATVVDADIMNSLQEEIANAVEAAGFTLSLANQAQLASAAVQLQASYKISGSGVANQADLTLAAGPAAQDPTPDSGFGLASNTITVPTAGIYLVEVTVRVSNAATGNPSGMGVYVHVGSGETYKIYTDRNTANASEIMLVSGSVLVEIAVPGTNTIQIEAYASGTGSPALTVDGGDDTVNRVIVRRIRGV